MLPFWFIFTIFQTQVTLLQLRLSGLASAAKTSGTCWDRNSQESTDLFFEYVGGNNTGTKEGPGGQSARRRFRGRVIVVYLLTRNPAMLFH